MSNSQLFFIFNVYSLLMDLRVIVMFKNRTETDVTQLLNFNATGILAGICLFF